MEVLRQITNPLCPKHSKTKEQVMHVCVEPSCEAQPLLCVKCIREDLHKDHETRSLLEFASCIDNSRYDESLIKKASNFEEEIKASRVNCLDFIGSLKCSLVSRCTELENAAV